jgi:hypothetical protein
LDATVVTDDTRPGCPVVGVRLTHRQSLGVEHIRLLTAFPQLEELDLWNSALTDEHLQVIETLTRLKRLDISGSLVRLTDKGSRAVCSLPDLEALALRGFRLDPEAMQAVVSCRKLRVLDVSDSSLQGSALEKLKGAESLRELVMRCNNVTSDLLVGCSRIPQLHVLRIAPKGKTISLKPLADMRELDVLECMTLTDGDLAELAGFPALKEVAIRGGFGSRGIAALSRSTSVKHVFVVSAELGREDLRHIAGMAGLESLRLYGGTIQGGGLDELTAAPHLSEVCLEGVRGVDDAALMELGKCKMLRNLCVKYGAVTEGGLAAFAKARPDVAVKPKCPPQFPPFFQYLE